MLEPLSRRCQAAGSPWNSPVILSKPTWKLCCTMYGVPMLMASPSADELFLSLSFFFFLSPDLESDLNSGILVFCKRITNITVWFWSSEKMGYTIHGIWSWTTATKMWSASAHYFNKVCLMSIFVLHQIEFIFNPPPFEMNNWHRAALG